MEVSVKYQTIMKQRILAFQRFLNLYHHIDQMPDICCIIYEACPSMHIFIVREARADSSSLLHVNVVTCSDISLHIVRSESNAELVVFKLFYASDLHDRRPSFQ